LVNFLLNECNLYNIDGEGHNELMRAMIVNDEPIFDMIYNKMSEDNKINAVMQ